MVAHFLEASVNFQTGDVLTAYGIVFAVLGVLVVVNYYSAIQRDKANKK